MKIPGKILSITAIFFIIGLPVLAETDEEDELPAFDEFVKLSFMPEMTYQEAPVYPPELSKAGKEGVVWLQALIKSDGTVVEARILKPGEDKRFDEAALTAAMKCKYKPGLDENKKPTACWVSYKVDFVLRDVKAEEEQADK